MRPLTASAGLLPLALLLLLPAASAAAEEEEPAAAEEEPRPSGRVIDLGVPRVHSYYMAGLSTLTEDWSVGAIGMYRTKRVTNYTFLDLQMHGYVVPRLDDDLEEEEEALVPFAYFARARLKRSERSFDLPWFYDWTVYELKTSSEEDLNLRASIASGYGALLVEQGDVENASLLNVELGFLLDYASLDEYTSGVSSGYVLAALEFDFELAPLAGKVRNLLSYQLTSAAEELAANQTRYDLDARVGLFLTPHLELALGLIYTRYLLLEWGESAQPEGTLALYGGLTVRD